jgi:hypothetical protein
MQLEFEIKYSHLIIITDGLLTDLVSIYFIYTFPETYFV